MQTVIWIFLIVSFFINGAFALFYGLHMRASIKPEKLAYSILFPLWWIDTEVLTDIGKKYRTKYLVHLFIGSIIMFVALFYWAYGELGTIG